MLPIRTAYYTFLEIRHPEVTKNPYQVLFPKGEPKRGISPWTNTLTTISNISMTTSRYWSIFAKKNKMKTIFCFHSSASWVEVRR